MIGLHMKLGKIMDNKLIKKCTCCGKEHFNYDELEHLPRAKGEDIAPEYEFYNCTCGSTILIKEWTDTRNKGGE